MTSLGFTILLGKDEWRKVFNAFETVGGLEYYIIEQESYPELLTPMQCVGQ
jgi:hypothetical protein